jgi:SAM-dependent methyltransferase
VSTNDLFAGKAEQYVRHRIDYPEAVIGPALAAIALSSDDVVADLGSGTGMLARWILERGNRVLGVEPDAGMRAMAEQRLAAQPRFVSVPGRAEATTLPTSSVDVITVGNAFHYFAPVEARAEALRILRPGGRVLILGHAKASRPNPFMLSYIRFLETIARPEQWAFHEEDRQLTSLRAFFDGRPFHGAEVPPTSHAFSWEDLRGRFLSTSLAPPEGDVREEVLAGLKQVFDAFAAAGIVQFQLHWGYWWGTLQD